jgi:hypothetical protein
MKSRQRAFTTCLTAATVAVAVLTGCSSGSGHATSWVPGMPAGGTTKAAGGGSPRGGSAGGGLVGGGALGGLAPSHAGSHAGAPAGGAGPQWVISMPGSLAGFPRVAPPDDDALRAIDASIQDTARQLGGQSVGAVYDDAQDDSYIAVFGVNGSGFNPADVQDVKTESSEAALPRGSVVLWPRVDPGPHGGDDLCQFMTVASSVNLGMGGDSAVATQQTDCYWMTTTTFGAVYFLDKGDLKVSGNSEQITPAIAGPFMITVRNAVEHRRG